MTFTSERHLRQGPHRRTKRVVVVWIRRRFLPGHVEHRRAARRPTRHRLILAA